MHSSVDLGVRSSNFCHGQFFTLEKNVCEVRKSSAFLID
jgi:hypothetical protein